MTENVICKPLTYTSLLSTHQQARNLFHMERKTKEKVSHCLESKAKGFSLVVAGIRMAMLWLCGLPTPEACEIRKSRRRPTSIVIMVTTM